MRCLSGAELNGSLILFNFFRRSRPPAEPLQGHSGIQRTTRRPCAPLPHAGLQRPAARGESSGSAGGWNRRSWRDRHEPGLAGWQSVVEFPELLFQVVGLEGIVVADLGNDLLALAAEHEAHE